MSITAVTAARTTSQAIHRFQPAADTPTDARLRVTALTEIGSRRPVRDDETRPHGISLELPANAPNVHPEILLRVAVRVAPHSSEELSVGHRAAGILDQDAQQLPFGPCQMDRNATTLDRWVREIDHRTVGFDDMRTSGDRNELRSAKLGAHTRL